MAAGLLLVLLTALTSVVLARPLCHEGSTYCEDPPNYPAHTIQQLLHTYSAFILLPSSSSISSEPAPPIIVGDDGVIIPDTPEGGNAVDGAGEEDSEDTNDVL